MVRPSGFFFKSKGSGLDSYLRGTLFIDIRGIYCFGTGYRYRCVKMFINIAFLSKTVKFTANI